MEQKRLNTLLWFGLLVGVVLAALSFFQIVPLQWGLFVYLTGIPVFGFTIFWLIFLVLFKNVDTGIILRGLKYNLIVGSMMLAVGIFTLSGFFIRRAFTGLLEPKWILFWPMILLACIIFGIGAFRKIIKKNVDTFQTWERFLDRKDLEPGAFLKRLVDDVLLQKTLLQESRIRWIRHVLIYWGFMLLFIADVSFALLHDYLPLFGVKQFAPHDNPVKLALDFSMEVFGAMILIGTSIALIWRYRVRNSEEKVYTDTPTAAFLFVVVLTGFVVEAVRLASSPYEPYMGYSFLGSILASFIRGWDVPFASLHTALWIFHAILASAFIAYFPIKRLIHSCATPVGKLMQSQKVLLEKKVAGVVSGLLQNEEE